MIFFKYISNTEIRSYTFLGLNIYFKQKKYPEKKIFFNGLIKIIKRFNNRTITSAKYIKLFNKTIYKKFNTCDIDVAYLFNIPIKITNLKDFYKKQINKTISKEYDDIYVFSYNSGEIYVFLTYFIDAYLKINKSKNPIIITRYKYHNDLIEMIYPKIPHVYLKNAPRLKNHSFVIGHQRFFQIYGSDFEYGEIKENRVSENPIPYFNLCKNHLNIPDDMLSVNPIKITEKMENSMTEKISKINLNMDNFIFISPEAKSYKMLPQKFWDEIIGYYKNKGIDIFLNINDHKFKRFDKYCKSIDLTFPEAFALAKKAKKIITLRSGLSEILMQTGVEHYIINTNEFGYKTLRVDKHLPLFNINTNHEYLIPETQTQEEMDRVKEIILNDKIEIGQ